MNKLRLWCSGQDQGRSGREMVQLGNQPGIQGCGRARPPARPDVSCGHASGSGSLRVDEVRLGLRSLRRRSPMSQQRMVAVADWLDLPQTRWRMTVGGCWGYPLGGQKVLVAHQVASWGQKEPAADHFLGQRSEVGRLQCQGNRGGRDPAAAPVGGRPHSEEGQTRSHRTDRTDSPWLQRGCSSREEWVDNIIIGLPAGYRSVIQF